MRRYMLRRQSNRDAFTKIYEAKLWSSGETLSGSGSTVEWSGSLRKSLPQLLAEVEAKSLMDAGCGDFNWMKTVDLNTVNYIGVDVVEPLIRQNTELYGAPSRSFLLADITKDRLPPADLVLCRHCFIHLPNRQVLMAIRNFKAAGVKYLLATTFPGIVHNDDIWPGSFRPVNLEAAPFNFPKPLRTIRDCPENGEADDAVLGLWLLAEL